ncbi:DIP13 homolog, putative [Plasmodium vinckei brucechwatti]|uniref:DIP13 homolog, putative n=1 Tax=Plasmodium vinckei brucechwatti TaxID=119398 RepID=A0A6V7SC02_PLAVN|nr:DIP13 homolog, putative [Plasmodium vinckei brucechwatti]
MLKMDHKKSMPLIKNEDELSKCIEVLRIKRQNIHEQILKEDDKERIQKEIALLNEKLQEVCNSITKKMQTRLEYDRTIKETSSAYTKIRESAKSLLHILKREETHLGSKLYNGTSDDDYKSFKDMRHIRN